MWFKCKKCGKWIEDKDAWIQLYYALAVGTSIYVYCCKEHAEGYEKE